MSDMMTLLLPNVISKQDYVDLPKVPYTSLHVGPAVQGVAPVKKKLSVILIRAYFCAFWPKLNFPKMQKLNLKIEKLPNVANYMQITFDHC